MSSTVRPESAEGEGKAAKISKNGDRPSLGELLARMAALAEDGERLRKALASSSEDQATGPIGKEALA